MTHHRYIVATVEIKMVDPSTPPATSGDPDTATLTPSLSNLAKNKKLTPTKSNKNHNVEGVVVVSMVVTDQ